MAAQTCTFDAAVDLNWNNAGNWATSVEADRVPIAGDTVVIPTGLGGAVDMDTALIVGDSITCNGDATMTAASGVVTSITGNIISNTSGVALTISGVGTVTIIGDISEGTGTTDIIALSGDSTLNVTGNVTSGSASNTDAIDCGSNDTTINITGDLSGGSGLNCRGINGSETMLVTVSGTISGGSGANAYGLYASDSTTPVSTVSAGTLAFTDTDTTPIVGTFATYAITSITVNGTAIGGSGGGGGGDPLWTW